MDVSITLSPAIKRVRDILQPVSQITLFRDPRINQILYLGFFLLYGLFYLGWQMDIQRIILTISTCLLTQYVFARIYGKDMHSLKSAMITGLGMSLLFRSAEVFPVVLAAFLAISSKFLITYKGKHFFNPGNFGIILGIILTGKGWISPGQWGNGTVLLVFLLITGLNVILRVGRMDTSIVFLFSFAGLQYLYQVIYLGWPADHFYHQFTSGTLLLYAFFMITDPVTTPNALKARIIWAFLTGVLAFILSKWFFIHTAPIWALFFIAPLTVLLDIIFIDKRFKWTTS